MKLSAGADIKYNLTSNLTLDATINPDFGQVEVDPATLNLSAYETFYEEKRPFFVANRERVQLRRSSAACSAATSPGSACCTRGASVGRRSSTDGWTIRPTYVDAPDDATILGAAKITGRTSSGYTVGLLDAVTGRESARYLTAARSARAHADRRAADQLLHGPRAQGAAAGRDDGRRRGDQHRAPARRRLRAHQPAAQQRERRGASTGATRGTTARIGGAAALALSDVRGSANAITLTQRSSTHYFQRPDREVTSDGLFSTAYDTTATSMRGYGLYTRLAKENGTGCGRPRPNWRSPGFEVNDLAFLDRTDYRWMSVNLARQLDQAGEVLSQHVRHRRRTAGVQLRRAPHRLRAAGVLRDRVPQLLEPALVRHPAGDERQRPAHARRPGGAAEGLQLRSRAGVDRPAPGGGVRRHAARLPGLRQHDVVELQPRHRAQAVVEHLRAALAELRLVAGQAAVPAAPGRSHRDGVQRQPLRVRLRDDAHRVARDARELDDASDRDAAALRAAVLRQRRLQRLQRVRSRRGRTYSVEYGKDVGTIARDDGDVESTSSIRTARVRRQRSPSTTRTSRAARCAARRCCGGSIGPAPRCSSSGRSSAPAATRTATSTSGATRAACSAIGRTMCS